MTTLLIAEHDNAHLKDATHKALSAATALGAPVHVLVAGSNARAAAEAAAKLAGVEKVLLGPCCTDRIVHALMALGLLSGDADRLRASKLEHMVHRMNCDSDLGRTTELCSRAQRIPNYSFQPADGGLHQGSSSVPGPFCQPVRPCSPMLWRCRSRWVGVVATSSLNTAVDRGGTITSASGWRSATMP
jgi:hypothetical protein